MKLIAEVVERVIPIVEATKDGGKSYVIEGVFLQSEVKNRNGRVYPFSVLEREVDRYNREYVQQNRALGELGHPDSPHINLDRVSHMITKLVHAVWQDRQVVHRRGREVWRVITRRGIVAQR